MDWREKKYLKKESHTYLLLLDGTKYKVVDVDHKEIEEEKRKLNLLYLNKEEFREVMVMTRKVSS